MALGIPEMLNENLVYQDTINNLLKETNIEKQYMGFDNYLVEDRQINNNSGEGWDFDDVEVNPEKPDAVVHTKAEIPYDPHNIFKPEFAR